MMILTIFHVLIDHLQVFGEMCIQLFGLLFNQVVFLLSCWKRSLYVLDIRYMTDT